MAGSPLLPLLLLGLASVGFYLLWGIGYQNHFDVHAQGACAAGVVRTVYTTFPPVDNFVRSSPFARRTRANSAQLCTLVSFFNAAGSVPQVGPFLTSFGGILLVPLGILHLEANRPSAPLLVAFSPLFVGTLFQCVGAAVACPLFFAAYLLLAPPRTPTLPSSRLRTIFPSLFLAYLLPAALMSDPLHLLTPAKQQGLSAFWQAFPLWLALVQPLSRLFLPSFLPSSPRAVLSSIAVLAAITHWAAIYELYEVALATNTPILDVARSIVNIPLHPTTYSGTAHLFLLFDAVVTTFATGLFVVLAPGRKMGVGKMLGGMLGMTVVGGPGAAFLWAWRSREGMADLKGKKRA